MRTILRPPIHAATLTAALTLGLALAVAPAAPAAPAAPTAPTATGSNAGLFGSADPTYDGAYRQSIAIIGLVAAKAAVPPAAITWLAAQQCASGAFEAYRADASAPCSTPDPGAFTGPDSNSTALAAMALQVSGRHPAASKAVAVLRSVQNADGGWGYTLGSPSDVNSTGLTLAALKSVAPNAATAKATRRSASRATAFLKKVQIPCTAARASRLGLPYQPNQPVNALASAQGLLGIAGGPPYQHIAPTALGRAGCNDPLIVQVSSYLDRLLNATRGAIPSPLDDKDTDWNATATAVVALGAAGAAPRAQAIGISSLGAHVVDYVGAGATASPAAAGTLIQAAVGAGRNPRSFGPGRVNLVSVLLGTLRA
jgi:hypothetical protein